MEKIFYKCDKLLPCSQTSTCGAPYCEYTSNSKHALFMSEPIIWDSKDGKFLTVSERKKLKELKGRAVRYYKLNSDT